jgi:hypothetical protein
VKVGGRYALPPGEIVVTRILEVSLAEITPELARASGFAGLVDLLKVAKHGPGRRVFVIDFRYETKTPMRTPRGKRKVNAAWHAKHRMPARATLAQRAKWHVAHARHCGCRPMPESVRVYLRGH